MNVEKGLMDVIEARLTFQPEIEMGTDEDRISTEGTAKLIQEYREVARLEIEREQKEKAQEQEYNLKVMQMENDRKDKMIDRGITIAGGIGSVAVLVWGTLKTFQFEKNGTVTSKVGKLFIESFRHFIKK